MQDPQLSTITICVVALLHNIHNSRLKILDSTITEFDQQTNENVRTTEPIWHNAVKNSKYPHDLRNLTHSVFLKKVSP